MPDQIDKEKVTLDLPSMTAFTSYIEALKEGFFRGIQPKKTQIEIQDIEKNPEKHFDDLNDQTPGNFTTPSGDVFQKVPYETLWLVSGDIFIGEISFRHELNDLLRDFGGHVGYGIRPSLSGQGLATLGLKLTGERATAMGMDRLLVTCAPDNSASEKIILKNGGVFENELENPFGFGPVKRYWIELKV